MGAEETASYFQGYRFDRPAIILAETIHICRDEDFADGATFAEFLSNFRSSSLAIVIPMEISTEYRYAQELFGLDLLEWTRWGGPPLEQIPVLAMSWLSFEKLHRLRPSLLLAQGATRFLRLPAPPASLKQFVEEVRRGEFVQTGAAWEMVRGGASNDAALTHHDLANDYYGAHRLWRGYAAALRQVQRSERNSEAIRAEIRRTEEACFPWTEMLEAKLKQPHVLRFQANADKEEFPAYQDLNDQEQTASHRLLESHVINGLASSTRMLLVDDQFEKGWADVLLSLLFRRHLFTYKTDHEAVYAEPAENGRSGMSDLRWARMVCVDSAERARYWLDYWDQMPLVQKSERQGFCRIGT